MRKFLSLLLFCTLLLLSGCIGDSAPTDTTAETTTAPTSPSTTVSLEAALQLPPEWLQHEIITPEEGVLILYEDASFQNTVIVGDVYITANAEVSFDHVLVKGNLYVHGRLTVHQENHAQKVYTYKYGAILCAAYDGFHGEVILSKDSCFGTGYSAAFITENALDYAFETWGKVEPETSPNTQPNRPSTGNRKH